MDNRLTKDLINCLEKTVESYANINNMKTYLGCVYGEIIGTGRSDYTQDSTEYNFMVGEKKLALIDIPGIEGDERAFEETIKNSLEKAHLIFYVNGSGKKIEKDSLIKIKKYMHDGTSVYFLLNAHCKAQQFRTPGIDKTYSEDLAETYEKQEDIINQTEKELISIIGNNYRGNICLNGLLAFCAVAFNKQNETSIVDSENKYLRRDQIKYLAEYSQDKIQMKKESHIDEICNVINCKVDNFDEDIKYENLKKLKNRLDENIIKIENLKNSETKKLNGFIGIYNDFERACYSAKEDYLLTMRHVAVNVVQAAFDDLLVTLFERIENDKGKTKSREIQEIVSNNKDIIIKKIENGLNKRINEAQLAFSEDIEEAQKRMKKDFERNILDYEINLNTDKLDIGSSFEKALKYNWKDFGKHAFTVGSLAASGAGIGSLIAPGVGTAIGAGIGAVVGVLSSIWNFLANKKSRINNAKSKLQQEINKQVDSISEDIKMELKKMNYEEKINNIYDSIYQEIEKEKKKMEDVKTIIIKVENEMKTQQRMIG